jgi:type I restriction enzyme R subunit
MRQHLKYEIRLGLGRNPDYYQPLAQRLDTLIKEHEAGRLTQAQFLLNFHALIEDVRNEQREGQTLGFHTERETAVFNSLKLLFDGHAAEATRQLFAAIAGELDIVGWAGKGEVKPATKAWCSKARPSCPPRPISWC